MLTRCPNCSTDFRVTPEQLRARGGKVRCGHCQNIFNGLSFLQEERSGEGQSLPALVAPGLAKRRKEEPLASPKERFKGARLFPDYVLMTGAWPRYLPKGELGLDVETTSASSEQCGVLEEVPSLSEYQKAPPHKETLSVRDSGTFLWRRNHEQPYSQLYQVIAVFLACLLFGQLLYYYRTPWSVSVPFIGVMFKVMGVYVPPHRKAEQIAIEVSDLQSDELRKRLVFSALLLNRAAFSQDWPALEMTLIDPHEKPISRRVLYPKDYLPKDAPRLLAPHGEQLVKLWISSDQLNATGYRAYVFFP